MGGIFEKAPGSLVNVSRSGTSVDPDLVQSPPDRWLWLTFMGASWEKRATSREVACRFHPSEWQDV